MNTNGKTVSVRSQGVKSTLEETYLNLKSLIEGDALPPGKRLTESGMAKRFGVSRATIREAFARLEAEGILAARAPYGGRYVEYIENVDPQEALHRYELREAVEALAARLAAVNMTGQQVLRLRELAAEAGEFLGSNDLEELNRRGRRVHAYLIEHCGNPLIGRVWRNFNLTPPSSRESFVAKFRSVLPVETSHQHLLEVVDAVAGHDPKKAEQAMRVQAREVTEAVRKVLTGE